MPEPVRGYITKAGRFFTTAEEAELNEAEVELEEALTDSGVNPESVLELIVHRQDQVLRFVTALKGLANARFTNEDDQAHQGNSYQPE